MSLNRRAALRLTKRQFKALTGGVTPRPAKYGNQRVEVDGRMVDSKREARDYENFKRKVAARLLRGYVHQVSIPLPSGKRRMRIDHMEVAGPADSEGWVKVRFSDSKGFETPAWSTKRDEVEYATGIRILCI